jgi:carbamoyl-phosphate synthase small subunit
LKGCLVLENGAVLAGVLMGAKRRSYGEVVFHTGMTGYQEILTDPSYANQMVVMTYPLIGNYGINEQDFEAKKPWLTGFIVGEACDAPSHHLAGQTLDDYLAAQGVTMLAGVDTRKLVRMIREHGSLKGYIVESAEAEEAKGWEFPSVPADVVKQVTTPGIYRHSFHGEHHVVLVDFGAKANIAHSLAALGCRVTVVPATVSLESVKALQPDGIMLSNGPGDPMDCAELLPLVRELGALYPMFGICLGHQLISLAYGARTEKMKFGHRGSNHPVKDLQSGKVWMTSQNHGYAVCQDAMPPDLLVTHVNVNDGTIEGVRHRQLPVFSVQFHPEAAPGPQDAHPLFDQFLQLMAERKGQSLAYAT